MKNFRKKRTIKKDKKGITKKNYNKNYKKIHRFTKKYDGGFNFSKLLPLLTTMYGSNALIQFHKPVLSRKLPLGYTHDSNIVILSQISNGDGNKGPPKNPNTIFINFDDENNDDENKYEEYIIPVNEKGVLELEGALTKLGVNPKNFLDILKYNNKLSKRHKEIILTL